MILIIGTMSFLTSKDEEIKEYTDKEQLTLIHSIIAKIDCADELEAGILGEEALTVGFDSYLIPEVYNGDIHYDCEDSNLLINVDDFKKDYLT